MASVGLSEVDLDSMADAEADVETVKTEEDEIDIGTLSKSSEAAPVIKLSNVLLIDALKRGPPTSTSSLTRRSSGSGSASTASSTT